MQITVNTTPFAADVCAATDRRAQKHCVVVVKATFDVDESGLCRISDEQEPLVYADVHHGDPATSSIKHENDFAPVKPRADVLVEGMAVAPAGRAVTRIDVALVGPGLDKRAIVTGDRRWVRSAGGVVASAPEPFVAMPLVWDRAFGGSDLSHASPMKHGTELRNLAGVGFHRNGNRDTVVGKALPNVERPDSAMREWSDKPEPIGFGPVGRSWQPRIGFAGTYDQRWMDEKLPFLPDDFDDRYFQSAPPDQQLEGLSPGGTFGCLHMNARGRFTVALPELRVPVRFTVGDRVEARTLSADTLIMAPARERIVLVGRASVPLPRKMVALREVQIGPRKPPAGRPRFARLGEAVAALRRRS